MGICAFHWALAKALEGPQGEVLRLREQVASLQAALDNSNELAARRERDADSYLRQAHGLLGQVKFLEAELKATEGSYLEQVAKLQAVADAADQMFQQLSDTRAGLWTKVRVSDNRGEEGERLVPVQGAEALTRAVARLRASGWKNKLERLIGEQRAARMAPQEQKGETP